MTFKLIDQNQWPRKEYFEHYMYQVPCTYSITLSLDITVFMSALKEKKIPFYPAIIHAISVIVNKHHEFRTALNEQGNVGIFDTIHPAYAIFNSKLKTFSSIWTTYQENFSVFYHHMKADIDQYKDTTLLFPKPHTPPNTFNISSYPWQTFTALHLNLPQGMNYLLPIFTVGKYESAPQAHKEVTQEVLWIV